MPSLKFKLTFTLLSLSTIYACSWVDSTGRQENRAPTVSISAHTEGVNDDQPTTFESNQTLVAQERQTITVSFQDLDGNLDVDSTTLAVAAIGPSAGTHCNAYFLPFEGADSIETACQPSLESAQCQLSFIKKPDAVTTTYQLSVPALKRPVAARISISAKDSDGQSVNVEQNACFQAVNDAPIANSDVYQVEYLGSRTVTDIQFNEECAVVKGSGVLANDNDDFDSQSARQDNLPCITATLTSGPAHSASPVTLSNAGGFSYVSDGTLSPGQSDSFTYSVSDGFLQSAPATVRLDIVGDNNPPIIATNTAFSTREDEALSISLSQLGSDPENTPLRLPFYTQPANGSLALADSPNTLIYTPNAEFSGQETFDFRIEDLAGASATGSATIQVKPVNDSPTINTLNNLVLRGDAARFISVQFADKETEAALVQLTASSSNAGVASVAFPDQITPDTRNPLKGSTNLRIQPIGNGTTNIKVQLRDRGFAGQAAKTSSKSFVLTVSGINRAPIAVNDAITLRPGQSRDIQVLANDYDEDRDTLSVAKITATASKGNATVISNSGVRYTANLNTSGKDQFTYQIRDQHGATATATVFITIAANRAPVVTNPAQIETDGSVEKTRELSRNASDPDGDQITFTASLPSWATLTPTGKLAIKPLDPATISFWRYVEYLGQRQLRRCQCNVG